MTNSQNLTPEQQTIANLKKVLAVNSIINTTLDHNELLGIIMKTAAEVVHADAASLMLLDETGEELIFKVALGEKGSQLQEQFRVKVGEGIAGTCAGTGESLLVNDIQKDPRFAKRFDDATGFKSQAIICVPMRVQDKMLGVLEALNPLDRAEFSQNDLELLEAFAEQASISVENTRMHEELVNQEKTRRELEIATEIQESLLPDLQINHPRLDIGAKSISAREVGGDLYDVIELGENRYAIALGDVSGKGVPAALYMVRTITNFRFFAPQTDNTAELITNLNNALADGASRGMFVTLSCLIVDLEKQTMQYASGGHHPILKRSADGKTENLKNNAGLPVGLMEGSDYTFDEIALTPGDVFLLYTDGIVEARNLSGEEYELPRFEESVRPPQESCAAYCAEALRVLDEFTKDAPQHDDMTLLALSLKAKP